MILCYLLWFSRSICGSFSYVAEGSDWCWLYSKHIIVRDNTYDSSWCLLGTLVKCLNSMPWPTHNHQPSFQIVSVILAIDVGNGSATTSNSWNLWYNGIKRSTVWKHLLVTQKQTLLTWPMLETWNFRVKRSKIASILFTWNMIFQTKWFFKSNSWNFRRFRCFSILTGSVSVIFA